MKKFWQQPRPAIVILGFISGLLLLVYATGVFSKKSATPASRSYPNLVAKAVISPNSQVKTGRPLRLKIPSLKIDAAVEAVGLTPQGAMAVPKNTSDVAWFSLGPRPGDPGSAVISGHLDWYNGVNAVFNNLYKLHPGDKIYLDNDQGKALTFVVRRSSLYAATADATPIFTSATGTHVNLVTCAGVWNKFKNSYTKRLVIFTDLLP